MSHNIKATATQRGMIRATNPDAILGTLGEQAATAVAITGGSITGITDIAIADGGTGASTAVDARTSLGLVIGTHVQAYDAALQSISGLTTDADTMIYTTAADAYATTLLTSAGRALIDDASSTAQRATLGLGTLAVENTSAVPTLTMAGAIAMANFNITGLPATPSGPDAAVSKQYADAIASGLSDFKNSVLVATTGNITLTGEQTIDGVLTSGSRVLVKSQTTAAENGVYVTGIPWTRSTDMDASTEVTTGTYVYVESGTFQQRTAWVVTAAPATLGTNPMTWVQFSGINDTIAGAGLTQSAGVVSVGQGSGITVAGDTVAVDFSGVDGALSVINAADAASVGVASTSARHDHQHAVSTGIDTDIKPMGSRTAGTSTALSRADHVHSSVPAANDTALGAFAGNRWAGYFTSLASNSAFQTAGIAVKTSAYTVVNTTDHILLLDSTTASFTVTLPSAATSNGCYLRLQQVNSTNTVTIDAAAAELVDGATTYELGLQYEAIDIVCDGTAWHILG